MIKDMIQMSYLSIVAALTLLFFILFNSTLDKNRKFPFLTACLISLSMVICNILFYVFQGNGSHRILLRIADAVSFAISGPVILPFIHLTNVINRPVRRCLNLLAAANVLLSIASIWNGCIFDFDASGAEKLGWLSPIPYFLSALYLAVLLFASLQKFRLGFRLESCFIVFLSIGIVTGTILNTVFHFHFLISGMAVLSTTFYYMFFTGQTLTRDAMTGARNRHSFYKDVRIMQKKQMYVISIDLNGLKTINDTQGHDAGDKAIIALAECGFSVLPVRSRFYRMGGDEFAALIPNCTAAEAEQTVQRLKQAIEKRGFSAAVGICEFRKGMELDAVFRDADAQMYSDKAEMKRR